MYYQIGKYDPSNQFFNYRNKDILELYKQYTQEKIIKTNTLITKYTYNNIEEQMQLNKLKITIKIKINPLKHKIRSVKHHDNDHD